MVGLVSARFGVVQLLVCTFLVHTKTWVVCVVSAPFGVFYVLVCTLLLCVCYLNILQKTQIEIWFSFQVFKSKISFYPLPKSNQLSARRLLREVWREDIF